MKDEIKEIFPKEFYINKKEEMVAEVSLENLNKIVDYITNLQTIEQQYSAILSENAELEKKIKDLQAIEQEHQRINGELREENKRLRETNKIFSERIISENNPDYKARCDKALDSVSKLKQSVQSFGDEVPCWLDDFERILNGDKE